MAYELSLWGKPWGFSLREIPSDKVCIWHGSLDNGTTIAMGKYIASEIGCKLVEFPDRGHMLLFTILDDVIAWINGSAIYI